jgi:hypothetical protein
MLKKLSISSMIAISYMFFIRILGTFYKNYFPSNVYVAGLTEFLYIKSLFILILFYYFFSRDYAENISESLKKFPFYLLSDIH